MIQPRVLVTGATGLLGATLVDAWRTDWQVAALAQRFRFGLADVENVSMDLGDLAALPGLVERLAPDLIVHCAALTNLDLCEQQPALARTIHRDATAVLARAAQRRGAAFVAISTDAVFGQGERAHREDDPVFPLSAYARTKWEGEQAALDETGGEALVVRTCIHGWNAQPKSSLSEWILGELRAGRSLTGFTDVFFTPLLCNTLGRALPRLLERKAKGVVHVAGADIISKYDFAVALARQFGLDEQLVRRGSIADSPLRASRPRFPCLDSARFAALTSWPLARTADDFAEMKRLEDGGYPQRLRGLVSRN
ncbi:MAG TPA: SDR family oxidoreductase [Polyangia bacterium]|jgi:dTDP-4-dehydrorhamnose reductase|nr:SDR family oxidoreductase [Polyangia bacterium]